MGVVNNCIPYTMYPIAMNWGVNIGVVAILAATSPLIACVCALFVTKEKLTIRRGAGGWRRSVLLRFDGIVGLLLGVGGVALLSAEKFHTHKNGALCWDGNRVDDDFSVWQ